MSGFGYGLLAAAALAGVPAGHRRRSGGPAPTSIAGCGDFAALHGARAAEAGPCHLDDVADSGGKRRRLLSWMARDRAACRTRGAIRMRTPVMRGSHCRDRSIWKSSPRLRPPAPCRRPRGSTSEDPLLVPYEVTQCAAARDPIAADRLVRSKRRSAEEVEAVDRLQPALNCLRQARRPPRPQSHHDPQPDGRGPLQGARRRPCRPGDRPERCAVGYMQRAVNWRARRQSLVARRRVARPRITRDSLCLQPTHGWGQGRGQCPAGPTTSSPTKPMDGAVRLHDERAIRARSAPISRPCRAAIGQRTDRLVPLPTGRRLPVASYLGPVQRRDGPGSRASNCSPWISPAPPRRRRRSERASSAALPADEARAGDRFRLRLRALR